MTGRSFFDAPTVPRLVQIIDEVRTGRLLIPDFQRPFMWDDERRLLLLDSVVKGMPIGSFLVWRTRLKPLKTYPKLGPFLLPQASPGDIASYLIDGHQRLTTLFAALTPLDGLVPDEDGPRWPIYYDLDSDFSDQGFRLSSRRQPPPPTWIPVADLLHPFRLFAFQKRLLQFGWSTWAERAEELASRFKDYQVPVVPLISDDLSTVTASFVRVNRQGLPMPESMMVRALGYGTFDFEEEIDRLRARLAPHGWQDLDSQLVVNALKVRFGLDVYKATPQDLHARIKADPKGVFESLARDLETAISLLAYQCGVRGPQALPYAYQLVALIELAAAWWASTPTPAAVQPPLLPPPLPLDLLRAWFWRTTYSGYFTGMTSNRIRRAVDEVARWAGGDRRLPDDLPTQVALPRRFDYKSTRSRALTLLMLFDGSPQHGYLAAQGDLLGREGASAVARLYPNESAQDSANRVVATADDLQQLRQVLQGGIIDPGARTMLLARYSIPEAALERALASGDPQVVLDARWAQISAWERSIVESMGMQVID